MGLLFSKSEEKLCLFPDQKKFPRDLLGLVAKFATQRDDDFILPFWLSCKQLYNTPWLRRLALSKIKHERLRSIFTPLEFTTLRSTLLFWRPNHENVVHVYMDGNPVLVSSPMNMFMFLKLPCRVECYFNSCKKCSYFYNDAKRTYFSILQVAFKYSHDSKGKMFKRYSIVLSSKK